jgi:hypothetical protein
MAPWPLSGLPRDAHVHQQIQLLIRRASRVRHGAVVISKLGDDFFAELTAYVVELTPPWLLEWKGSPHETEFLCTLALCVRSEFEGN